jgi:ubiquinone/menaquinone biosynthesis C-methylase UbiE
MTASANPIVETYSRLAHEYDDDLNIKSCWGQASQKAIASIGFRESDKLILDVGCGTGRAVASLAATARPDVTFIAVDPADTMCEIARERTHSDERIRVLHGAFENIPLESHSVDNLYSILAFHWVTDLQASIAEISRVLKPGGAMDLFFIGRNNGREFIQKTSPIFLKYMGPARFLDSARLRKQLTRESALQLFSQKCDPTRLRVEESYDTYFDTLEGHWAWWVRIEGHFVKIPADEKAECDLEVKHALESLHGPKGIPYTIHQLRVSLRHP